MKTCNKCNQTKSLTQYKIDTRNKSGLQGICNDCQREYKRASRAARMAGTLKLKVVSEKTCNKCQTLKPIGQFYKDAGIADGHATICKPCKTANTDKWREENREQYNASMRTYNAEHYQKHRLARYKMTPEQHAQLLLDQKGVCAICEQLPKGTRPLVVDHNHKTGKSRGLLCYGCNRALHVLETEQLLTKAMTYLEKHKKSA